MGFNPDNTSMRISGRDGGSYKSGDVGTRPKGDPKTGKDFKKVLAKTDDEDEENQAAKEIIEESDGIVAAINDEVKKKAPMSLFDLTSGKGAGKAMMTPDDQAVKTVDSPTALYAKMTSIDVKKTVKEPVFVESEDIPVQPTTDKDKFTTRFATEQTDLSYVNPLAVTTNQQPSVNLNISTEKAVIPVSNIQEIINQMVAKVTEMKNAGTTETVVTLKHPPIFEGATIVVTGFDSAKNEFNITIENLTQAAKQLLDQQGNKDSLLHSLEQKGYAVHILTTTTVAENRPVASLPQDEQTGRQRGDEREQKEQQQRRGQHQA